MVLKSGVDVRRRKGAGILRVDLQAGSTTFAATVPVGYAEGYRRALSGRAEALIRGERRPPWVGSRWTPASRGDGSVEVGDEVVLLGGQGDERVTAEEPARGQHDKLRGNNRVNPPARREEL